MYCGHTIFITPICEVHPIIYSVFAIIVYWLLPRNRCHNFLVTPFLIGPDAFFDCGHNIFCHSVMPWRSCATRKDAGLDTLGETQRILITQEVSLRACPIVTSQKTMAAQFLLQNRDGALAIFRKYYWKYTRLYWYLSTSLSFYYITLTMYLWYLIGLLKK